MNATRIVLIDDDSSWLEALSEYLQRRGFSVLAAANPADGLALLQKYDIPVVICDYHMPGMDGLEVVRSIRRQLRDTAVLLMSSEAEPAIAAGALAAGAQAFLAKSTPPTLLVRKLWQILAELAPAGSGPSPLHLWQRLLPSPQRVKSGRGKHRPAARSPATRSHSPKPAR